MDDYTENVKRGAAWLDWNYGERWPSQVDIRTLHMDESDRCIVGQTLGGGIQCRAFWSLFEAYGDEWLCHHGFDVPDGDDAPTVYRRYLDLRLAWVEEILERRAGLTGMDIGKEQPARVVEPVKNPVPERLPKREPQTAPAPTRVPEKEPEKVPVKT